MCLKAHLLQRVSLFMRLMHEIALYRYLLEFSVTMVMLHHYQELVVAIAIYLYINSLIHIDLLIHDLFCVYCSSEIIHRTKIFVADLIRKK